MFGLSFGKILLLVIVVAAIFFAFRWLDLSRREKLAQKTTGRVGRRGQRRATVVELERNPDTGAYEPPRNGRS